MIFCHFYIHIKIDIFLTQKEFNYIDILLKKDPATVLKINIVFNILITLDD